MENGETKSIKFTYETMDKTNLDEMFYETVNNLCRLDRKHPFTTEEFDEMLVEAYKSACFRKNRIPAQA